MSTSSIIGAVDVSTTDVNKSSCTNMATTEPSVSSEVRSLLIMSLLQHFQKNNCRKWLGREICMQVIGTSKFRPVADLNLDFVRKWYNNSGLPGCTSNSPATAEEKTLDEERRLCICQQSLEYLSKCTDTEFPGLREDELYIEPAVTTTPISSTTESKATQSAAEHDELYVVWKALDENQHTLFVGERNPYRLLKSMLPSIDSQVILKHKDTILKWVKDGAVQSPWRSTREIWIKLCELVNTISSDLTMDDCELFGWYFNKIAT